MDKTFGCLPKDREFKSRHEDNVQPLWRDATVVESFWGDIVLMVKHIAHNDGDTGSSPVVATNH